MRARPRRSRGLRCTARGSPYPALLSGCPAKWAALASPAPPSSSSRGYPQWQTSQASREGGARASSLAGALGMIAEYAQHCGHAGLLRERIDGETGR
ncbi:DUF664 domain-containing protein [Streptomyces albiaxialis]|uniref:mycothiol transferase n=1 Tax=Streptomyces albiaxialis TaxID=329523 RepID=UPI0031DA4F04